MNALIITKDIRELRFLQSIMEEEIQGEILLEWDIGKAESLLRRRNVEILLCEAGEEEQETWDFLAQICRKRKGPEIVVLIREPRSLNGRVLEKLPGACFLGLPVDLETARNVLRTAVEAAQNRMKEEQLVRENFYWQCHKGVIQQQFWSDLLSGRISLEPADFIKRAADCGIEMKLSDRYQIALLSRKLIRKRNTQIENQTRETLVSHANKWFQRQDADFILVEQLRPFLIVRNMPKDEFLFQCKGLIRDLRENCGIPLCVYCDFDVYCENLFSSAVSVMTTEKEAMEQEPGIYPALRGKGRKREEMAVLIPENLEEMVRNGNHQQVVQSLFHILEEQSAKGRMSGSYLKALRLDVLQLVYSILREHSIPAHLLMMKPELREMEINAHISAENFMAWFDAVLQSLPDNKSAHSLTEAVRTYVRDHIHEEINRDKVAQALHMNADYLGRLYKRETGESIGNYVLGVKMKEACRMLALTKEPIGEIGAGLGYDNFAHFSKLFKKAEGCTPREYRIQHSFNEQG